MEAWLTSFLHSFCTLLEQAGTHNSGTLPLICSSCSVHTVPALSVYLTKACRCAQTTKGTLLTHPALVVREACVPASHSTITIRETALGRLLFPGHCANSRLHIPPVSLGKRTTYMSWTFILRTRPQVCHISRSYGGSLRECRPGYTIFVFSLSLSAACSYLPEMSSSIPLEP